MIQHDCLSGSHQSLRNWNIPIILQGQMPSSVRKIKVAITSRPTLSTCANFQKALNFLVSHMYVGRSLIVSKELFYRRSQIFVCS